VPLALHEVEEKLTEFVRGSHRRTVWRA
jgi:hypothetical protein